MFANKLSELCLENNLDVSYTKCFSSKSKDWIETLPFVDTMPIMIMSIGKIRYIEKLIQTTCDQTLKELLNG